MKIAVIGAGAIGGYFGGRLANAGHEVGFLARGVNLEAMQRQGLVVRSVAGEFVMPEVLASNDPGDLGVADVVLLAVKTWQLDAVLDRLNPLVGADTAMFLFVVPFGGLGAVTDASIGVLRARPGTRQLLVTLMGEIRDVARAMEVDLPADVVERTLAFVDQQPANGRSSLQRDILAGRPSDLKAWTGAVVRLGAATATPVHDMVYELLSARVEQSALALG